MATMRDIARSSSLTRDVAATSPVDATCSVLLPCPRTFNGRCRYVVRSWSCEKCKYPLKYGFDMFFYCACGKAPATSYAFKCSNDQHGDSFDQFSEKDMNYLLMRMKSSKEINILLFGETGVGKSTWINAFANYMSFPTFEEAESGKPVYMIPSFHSIYSSGRIKEVFIGSEEGKAKFVKEENGQSVTQSTASYIFRYGELGIRLIDTPGIGDTRGLETDKENLQNVLDYLSHFDELHGICILLPSNEARLTIQFKFCMRELFRQLHKDACKNIVFCFTSSRSTDFIPGTTSSILKHLLREIADIPIELNGNTMYCMDSESVVYLFAVKQGISFTDSSIREIRKDSWDASVKETGRMLERILKLTPHKLRNTLSLNEIRRIILHLCKGPLIEISSNIQQNICRLKAKEAILLNAHEASDDGGLAAIKCHFKPLNRPRVVCNSPACSTNMTFVVQGDIETLQYKQVCCDGCQAPHIRLCESIALSGKCKRCGCPAGYHKKMSYEVVAQHVNSIDPKTKTTKPQIVGQLETLKEKHMREQRCILEIAAKLMTYLEVHSVFQQSDSFVECLNQQIMNEEAVVEQRKKAGSLPIADHLKALLDEYNSIRSDKNLSNDKMTADDVDKLIRSLYQLPENGRRIQKALEVVEKSSADVLQLSDTVCKPYLQRIRASRRNAVQNVVCKSAASSPPAGT